MTFRYEPKVDMFIEDQRFLSEDDWRVRLCRELHKRLSDDDPRAS
jgi:hypothetical protein